ncbi:tyrosine-type recombinase/integrase [Saezia sanguinis]|uniref:tyrosine-type recombinase/integrase n=1 Tax=Saezia sanguinis TaxID=1965230 RepID=UPI003041FB0A
MTLLSDYKIKQAKPSEKEQFLKDGNGLFFRIKNNGAKSWVFRFYWNGSQQKITLGKYPEISLKTARKMREEARELVALGIDPRQEKSRKIEQAVSDGLKFETFVQKWLEFKLKVINANTSKEKKNGGRQGTAIQIERYLRLDILPVLGKKVLKDISRADLLVVQRRIEERGALSITEKVRSWLNEIFRHAIAEGLIESNPAADMDIVAMPYRRNRHNPHLTMAEMPELMAAIHAMKSNRQTELGLRLLLLTGVRTGELRFAEPEQFDLETGIWSIPAEDVKQLQRQIRERSEKIPDYLVPLSRQAIEVIEELLQYKFAGQRYLLCHRSQPKEAISENTLNGALKRLGFKGRLTGHGIRATLSTALNELDYNKDWIEAQLSHSDKDVIRGTYNHAMYVEQRRQMMQDWADMLDKWQVEGLAQKKRNTSV